MDAILSTPLALCGSLFAFAGCEWEGFWGWSAWAGSDTAVSPSRRCWVWRSLRICRIGYYKEMENFEGGWSCDFEIDRSHYWWTRRLSGSSENLCLCLIGENCWSLDLWTSLMCLIRELERSLYFCLRLILTYLWLTA